ncbi:hypothetical protein ACFQYP_08615 [Nonomuraea antimicrobica]
MGAEGLVERVRRLADGGGRVLVGIAGCPGAGKSTLAGRLAGALTAAGLPAVWVPMDGFHLADVELERLGRLSRKGAADTFDAHGYLALLRRLRAETADTVYAPRSTARSSSPSPAPSPCRRARGSSSARATTCCPARSPGPGCAPP